MEADFNSVWSRVTGIPQQEAPEVQLRRFLLAEAEDVRTLNALLSRACDGTLRRKFAELGEEKRRQMKRLRAALYLLAGECECPELSKRAVSSNALAEIRTLYERAATASNAYRKAADTTNRPTLETIYRSLAAAEAAHAETLLSCAELLL